VGESLFHRGAPCHGFYGMVAGMIQLSVSNEEGVEKVVEIVGPGETLGEAVMFAVSLVATKVLFVPIDAVDRLLETDQGFARALLASMALRLHTMVADIEMYTLRSATQRFVSFLIREFGGRPGAREAQSVMLRSTKRVLASRLGLAPETLSRVMRDLADRGVIRVEGRRIVVPDTRLLATLDEVTGRPDVVALPMFLDRGQGQAARSGVVSQPAGRLFRSDGRRC
jgi:CRP-like cAMP-binding protein